MQSKKLVFCIVVALLIAGVWSQPSITAKSCVVVDGTTSYAIIGLSGTSGTPLPTTTGSVNIASLSGCTPVVRSVITPEANSADREFAVVIALDDMTGCTGSIGYTVDSVELSLSLATACGDNGMTMA